MTGGGWFIGFVAICAVLLGGCGGTVPGGSVPVSAPAGSPLPPAAETQGADESPGTGGAPSGPQPRFVLVAADASSGNPSLLVTDPAGIRTPVPVSGIPGYEIAARPGSTEIALSMTQCEDATTPCGSPLVLLDLATGEERPLTEYAPGIGDVWPSWSPDGSQLAFGSSRKGNAFGSEIYVIPAAGGTPVELVTGFTSALSPAWSPDGATIAFVGTDAEGGVGIDLVDASGGNVRRLTAHDGGNGLAWSPDGSRIAYHSTNLVPTGPNEATGYIAISVVNVADGSSTVVRATASNNRTPAWSPDGSTIAFILEEDGVPGRLALMNPDGSDVRILGVAEWNDMGFAWIP